MVNARDNIDTLASCVHSLMLETYIDRLAINIFRFFWPNILQYGQNSQWVHSISLNGKCFFEFIGKFLKF